MADLPDYYTQISALEAEAYSFTGGADASKPASPESRDVYLATDTKKLYICVTAGTWTGFDAAILIQGTLTLYENMDANSKKITSLAAPTANGDAARKKYVDDSVALYLPLAGGTMAGDLTIGANKIKTTNLLLKEGTSTILYLRNAADDAYRHLSALGLNFYEALYAMVNGAHLTASNENDRYFLFRARDNGVGPVEIARMQAATDPYFQMTLPMRLYPSAIPGTLVEGHFWYDATADRIKYRDAGATRILATDGVTKIGDLAAPDADFSMNTHKITSVVDPTADQDADTKAARDTAISAYTVKSKLVRKTADETVNNSTTVQNDDELTLAVGANEVWLITLELRFNSTTVADIKTGFSIPSGASITAQGYNAGHWDDLDITTPVSWSGTGNNHNIYCYLLYVGSTSAGNVQLQWAQNTAEVSDTKVLANSCLIGTKIG